MRFLDFCRTFIWLNGRPISFADRVYLDQVYASTDRNLILRCSRQVEKSTMLCNRITYEAVQNPGISMLYVCPRLEQAQVFIRSRLIPTIEGSPLIRRTLIGARRRRLPVMNLDFANGSRLHVRAAFNSADAARGVSADLLLIDEFQDIAGGNLPVLEETLSHSPRAQTIITGTPKLIDNHTEDVFRRSTACEWQVPCDACQRDVILDERVLGATGLECPDCAHAIDARNGRWAPRNPTSKWGRGYWINHLMVPWLTYEQILSRQTTYDPARFKNEVLGLPTSLGDHLLTREQIEACCLDVPMAQSIADVPVQHRDALICGVDWSGGGPSRTVLVIGYIRVDKHFTVVRIERFMGHEDPDTVIDEVARRCQQFNVRFIAADGGGNGLVFNRQLLSRWNDGQRPSLYAIVYGDSDQEPRQEGAIFRWRVGRSVTIANLIGRVQKRMLHFPRVADCGSFLDDFTCELVEYDDHSRTIRFTHPENQRDDALHATAYAELAGLRRHAVLLQRVQCNA